MSFNSIDDWLEMIKENGDNDITIMLAGNKCDLTKNRKIPNDKGIKKAKDLSKLLSFC